MGQWDGVCTPAAGARGPRAHGVHAGPSRSGSFPWCGTEPAASPAQARRASGLVRGCLSAGGCHPCPHLPAMLRGGGAGSGEQPVSGLAGLPLPPWRPGHGHTQPWPHRLADPALHAPWQATHPGLGLPGAAPEVHLACWQRPALGHPATRSHTLLTPAQTRTGQAPRVPRSRGLLPGPEWGQPQGHCRGLFPQALPAGPRLCPAFLLARHPHTCTLSGGTAAPSLQPHSSAGRSRLVPGGARPTQGPETELWALATRRLEQQTWSS